MTATQPPPGGGQSQRTHCLRVSGDFACFTRPEMKTERVSYDVITPSSVRALFEAVLWKPAIHWRVTRIEVLKPAAWLTVRRNEVSDVVPVGKVKQAMTAGHGQLGLYVEDARQQRAGRILKDVAYRLYAHIELNPDTAGPEDTLAKFNAMFERRARQGQVFHRPYLGCREFDARLDWVDPSQPVTEPTCGETRDLGWMLYDLDYSGSEPMPRFFEARMMDGVIQLPAWDSEEVRG